MEFLRIHADQRRLIDSQCGGKWVPYNPSFQKMLKSSQLGSLYKECKTYRSEVSISFKQKHLSPIQAFFPIMQSTQTAVITLSLGHAAFVTNHGIPKPRHDEILVRTAAVALNPIDWMLLGSTPSPNAVMGHDYAGTVVEVGESAQERFKVGDRVCGLVKGADRTRPESGTFAEYIVAKAAVQIRIPDGVSFEDAATVGVGAIATGQCLFGPSSLNLPWPENHSPSEGRDTILIYGGSTASGCWLIQVAKL